MNDPTDAHDSTELEPANLWIAHEYDDGEYWELEGNFDAALCITDDGDQWANVGGSYNERRDEYSVSIYAIEFENEDGQRFERETHGIESATFDTRDAAIAQVNEWMEQYDKTTLENELDNTGE